MAFIQKHASIHYNIPSAHSFTLDSVANVHSASRYSLSLSVPLSVSVSLSPSLSVSLFPNENSKVVIVVDRLFYSESLRSCCIRF